MKKWVANQAVKAAKDSEYPVFRHGAVFESGGRILFKSCNVEKPYAPKTGKSIHAEVSGLKAMMSKARLRYKTKVNIYVARVTPANRLVMSMPCHKCMRAIKESGIVDTIYYSTNEGTWKEAVV